MKGTLKVTKRLEAKVGLRVHALHGEGRPQTFALGWTTRRDGELRFFFFFWWSVAQVQKGVYWLL